MHGFFGSGATAVFFRAVEPCAAATWDADLFSDGLVTGNFLFDRLDHATLTALGIPGSDDFLGHDVITAGFDLASFSAVTSAAGGNTEHRTAG